MTHFWTFKVAVDLLKIRGKSKLVYTSKILNIHTDAYAIKKTQQILVCARSQQKVNKNS